jgi:hypothetical protein
LILKSGQGDRLPKQLLDAGFLGTAAGQQQLHQFLEPKDVVYLQPGRSRLGGSQDRSEAVTLSKPLLSG